MLNSRQSVPSVWFLYVFCTLSLFGILATVRKYETCRTYFPDARRFACMRFAYGMSPRGVR
jgi:hypothetical protein